MPTVSHMLSASVFVQKNNDCFLKPGIPAPNHVDDIEQLTNELNLT